MRKFTIQPGSALLGALLAATVLLSMSQKAAEETKYEYQIIIDVEEDAIGSMAKKGWEFVGYLGQSKKGAGADETLWRRAE